MKYSCKFCKKEFEKSQSLAAHVSSCKLNPNLENKVKKINETRKKNCGIVTRLLNCEYCGNEYEIVCSDKALKKGKFKKCCSDKCSHNLSVKNTDINEKNNKIKNYFKTNNFKYKIYICEWCGNEFTHKERNSKFCSNECSNKSRHNKLHKNALNHELGGLNPYTTYTHFKQGKYKGIQCDSSWELAFVIYCLDNNIKIERNKNALKYIFEDKEYNFYPDFLVNNKYVEIKGFWTKRNLAKKDQCKNVEFIDKDLIKKYIEYAETKYGKDFIKLYSQD